jgi:XTP/dITP diphosphohydrolase
MPHNSPPAPARRLVVATGNPGKLAEFRQLLAGLPFEVVGQAALGVAPVEETGASLRENALIKAHHAHAATGEAALADDSGLEVDALDGAPGVYSARYAGAAATDAANVAKLLQALAGVAAARRSARFRCVLAVVDAAAGAPPLLAEAVWDGWILEAPRGLGGFGYDPVFWVSECAATAAELDAADKNRRSHRGRALALIREQLAARTAARPAGRA